MNSKFRVKKRGTAVNLQGILLGDIRTAEVSLSKDDSQGHRRNLIRALFSSIEALAWQARDAVRVQAECYPNVYDPAEICALRDQAIYVDDRGNVGVRPLRVSLKASVRLTTNLLNKHPEAKPLPELDPVEWPNLVSSLGLRHRLTHPQAEIDMVVSEDELERARTAFRWFLGFCMITMAQALELTESANARMKAVMLEMRAPLEAEEE